METFALPQHLNKIIKDNLVLLQSENSRQKFDTLQLNISGYTDVMYLIGDIIKVCMLASENESNHKRIPEPATNIVGVLGIVLDLIPYEEAGLLDLLREYVLNPVEDEIISENLFLSPPASLSNEFSS